VTTGGAGHAHFADPPEYCMESAMKLIITASGLLFLAGMALADDVSKTDRLLCSAAEVIVCFEGAECTDVLPWELDVPQFVVIDLKQKSIATTRASGENRSTPIQSLHRSDSATFLQGIEGGRAFSFVIDHLTGLLTVAVSRDGLTVSVFGACTDSDV
jgi:hypothetical protein